MKNNNFVGTYKLESFEIEETSGLKRSWGKDVHGLLIYTSDGHMSGQPPLLIPHSSRDFRLQA